MQEHQTKLVHPMGVGANVTYYDLNQLDAFIGQVDLVDQGRVRPTTIFIGPLVEERLIAGHTYRTLIVDIDGSSVLCPQTTNDIIAELSSRKVISLRFCHWVAHELKRQQIPYFCGVNSFIPNCSQLRQQPAWIGSRWYTNMRTVTAATLVTFACPAQHQKVVIRVEISQAQLRERLAIVRAMIVASNHILASTINDELPCNQLITSVPPNLPELASIQLPQVTAAQLMQFGYEQHAEDICCISETYQHSHEDFSIFSAVAAANYTSRPPRALTRGRKLLAKKQHPKAHNKSSD
ncbi:hypothetical protein [Loigolactobacillus jiayinensis]|uniref:Uncharacterized protein n=1 Tax=Loigolactobacillus jiayinensis TaxID=2486016 RepID=A0ABW1RHQ5_9LACO|nr:hypothetical protein [Loigolactobacillus jiayinensis]